MRRSQRAPANRTYGAIVSAMSTAQDKSDAATRHDIARMASELMEARCVLNHIVSIYGDKFTPTTLDCARRVLGGDKQ